ncbi:hypothetical protein ABTM76_19550, partial [Acinetobacter baumannii]
GLIVGMVLVLMIVMLMIIVRVIVGMIVMGMVVLSGDRRGRFLSRKFLRCGDWRGVGMMLVVTLVSGREGRNVMSLTMLMIVFGVMYAI